MVDQVLFVTLLNDDLVKPVLGVDIEKDYEQRRDEKNRITGYLSVIFSRVVGRNGYNITCSQPRLDINAAPVKLTPALP